MQATDALMLCTITKEIRLLDGPQRHSELTKDLMLTRYSSMLTLARNFCTRLPTTEGVDEARVTERSAWL